jgi:hypothetical protein
VKKPERREADGDWSIDAVFSVADEQAEGHGGDQAVEAALAGAKSLAGGLFAAAALALIELALERGNEAGEVLLADIILRAGAHGADGDFLGHRSGKHDEGDVDAKFLDKGQGGGSAELGQVIVGEDDIRHGAGFERSQHLLGGFNARNGRVKAIAAQMPFEEKSVFRIVFDQQNRQWPVGQFDGGHSLSTSQYMPNWRVASAKSVKLTGLRM